MESKHTNTALLVMDMQTSILGRLADAAAFTANVAKAIAHARTNNIPVLYVVVGFRPGMPEVGVTNKGFVTSKERMGTANMDEWMRIDAAVAPLPNEMIVIKRRISAFTGSDLEVILRAQRIQHMVLTGIATGGVVLSTVREAADKDYRITVLADGCADADPEVQHVLTTKIFPRQADVISVEDWCNR